MPFSKTEWTYGLLTILLVLQAMTSPVSAEEMTADQIVGRAIANRKKIESYDVELEIEYGNQNAEVLAEFAHFYRAEGQLRVDLRYSSLTDSQTAVTGSPNYWLRSVFTPQRSIVFCDIAGPLQRAINIDSDPGRTIPDWQEESRRYDLRSLGFQTAGPLSADEMNSLLASASGEKAVVVETVDDFECCKVSFEFKSGIQCDLWFAKALGYSPIRLRCRSRDGVQAWQIALVVKEWKDSGLYFPVSYESTQTIGGKSEMLQRGRLVIHTLNVSLPVETFELTGLQVPKGKSIQLLPSNGPARIWDGENVAIKRQR